MDAVKTWFIEVGLKQMGPSAIRGGILGVVGFLAAKNGLLEPFGIHTANGITTIEWAKVSLMAIAGFPAVTASVVKMLNHHADQAVKAALPPQGETK